MQKQQQIFEIHKDRFKIIIFGWNTDKKYFIFTRFIDGIRSMESFDTHTEALKHYKARIN